MENNNNIDLNIYPVRDDSKNVYKLKHPIHPVLPDLERNFVLGLVAPRNSGKTTLYTNLLLNPNLFGRDNYAHAMIFSPTIYADITALPLRTHFEHSLYAKYSDSIVKDIIDYQKAHPEETRPKTIIIVDDSLGIKTRYLDMLITRARHWNVSIIVSSQQFKQVNKTARSNFTDLILGKTYNAKELENIYEEVGSLYGSKKRFYKMFAYATKKKYSFLYLKLDKNPPQAYVNFTEDITNKFPYDKNSLFADDEETEEKKREKKEREEMAQNDHDATENILSEGMSP